MAKKTSGEAKAKGDGRFAAMVADAIGVDQRGVYRNFQRGCPQTSIEAVVAWWESHVRPYGAPKDWGEVVQRFYRLSGKTPPRPVSVPSVESTFGPPVYREPAKPIQQRNPRLSKEKVEAAILREKLKKVKLENRVAAGELIPTADAELVLSELAADVADRFAQLPERLRMRFPEDIREAMVAEIDGEVRAILRLISASWKPSFAIDRGEGDDA